LSTAAAASSPLLMLDTNTASYVIKGQPPQVRQRLLKAPADRVVVSAVTEGELIYGVAKRGNPAALSTLLSEFLMRVTVLPWYSEVARTYGELRAASVAKGVTLGALDMMIAAHAATIKATLVTADHAFGHLGSGLRLEDWTQAG
jgi:tRNA(fMet)-specific endonuclease VapC